MQSSTGLTIEMSSSVDGVLYLINKNNSSEVLASRNEKGAGAGEMIELNESDIDETAFAQAYHRAVDPGNARTTAQDFIGLHGLDNPTASVIFQDSRIWVMAVICSWRQKPTQCLRRPCHCVFRQELFRQDC